MAVKRGGLGKGLDSMIPVLDSTATKKKTGRTAIDKEALQKAATRLKDTWMQKKLINIKKKRWNLRGNLENRYRL